MKNRTVLWSAALSTVSVMLIVGGLVLSVRPSYLGMRAGKADENYVSSQACISCHREHFDSWSKTYHSRMTQDATPASVQGDFTTNNRFEFQGITALMQRRADAFFITFTQAAGAQRTFEIVRTVGSRRIQQYVTRVNGQYLRLPVAYDIEHKRWMNLNGSFFAPDGVDYWQHLTVWDNNCVFCHNVKAQPHVDFRTNRYDTEVAELGIACGACHGPAAQHIDEASSPLTRYRWRMAPTATRDIVQPRKLDSDRSLMVCAHCHGQRVPEPETRIQAILTTGDPFNAGEDLGAYYKPIVRETKLAHVDFANRFWPNGAPRLTAYEYQGILRSACFKQGTPGARINCVSCHTMHSGDPKGQITAENRGNAACVQCHQNLGADVALQKHTGHAISSAGSLCYNCHMPRVVYGIMSFHPTHDISVPDPGLTAAQGVPNACNLCHMDKSVNWSIAAAARLWPRRFAATKGGANGAFDEPEAARMLYAGDALTRALAADALSGNGPAQPDVNWSTPLLLTALSDNYAIVRYFAVDGLARFNQNLPAPDYQRPLETQRATVSRWNELFEATRMRHAEELADRLRKQRADVDLEVGE